MPPDDNERDRNNWIARSRRHLHRRDVTQRVRRAADDDPGGRDRDIVVAVDVLFGHVIVVTRLGDSILQPKFSILRGELP